MPFKKVGENDYTHKGKHYTEKQVRAYYATEGFKREPSKSRGKHEKAMEGLKKSRP